MPGVVIAAAADDDDSEDGRHVSLEGAEQSL